jgi:hypothetical protein
MPGKNEYQASVKGQGSDANVPWKTLHVGRKSRRPYCHEKAGAGFER